MVKRSLTFVNAPFKPPKKKARPATIVPKLLLRRAPARKPLPATLTGNRQEIKSIDIPLAAGSPQTDLISTTAVFTGLNLIQEGASFYNRIGRRVMMRSLHLTGHFIISAGAVAGVSEYGRVMVIYDRQPNGAFPVIADVLTGYDNAGTTSTNSFSNININNADRFRILRDIRFHVGNNSATAASTQIDQIIDYTTNRINVNEFIRLNNLETHYKSTTNPGAIGDITTGSLFLCVFGNIAAATAGYSFQWSARLRFHDS